MQFIVSRSAFRVLTRQSLQNRKFDVYHIDLWRIGETADAAFAVGLDEIPLEDKTAVVVVIEWSERLKKILFPEKTFRVKIEGDGEEARKISIFQAEQKSSRGVFQNMKKLLVFLSAMFFVACSLTHEPQNVETPPPQAESQPKITDERALKLIKNKDAVAPFFQLMGEPQKYDWLASFKESGQTFEEYLRDNPTLPTAERRKIYIQPIGNFSVSQRKVLRLATDYMKAFYNLPVELKPEMKLENVPRDMERKNPYDGQRQIRTHYFLVDLLPGLLPADAAAFISFTDIDLYPDENWNFLFGQASLENRVGVWSLYRFGNPDKSPEDYDKFLARTLKIAMHETGHMFTMRHCAKYECLMSGTNHLGETDRRPLDTCPECTAKIAWAMNYEPAERCRNLAAFWEKQNWTEEKESFLKKAEAFSAAAAKQ